MKKLLVLGLIMAVISMLPGCINEKSVIGGNKSLKKAEIPNIAKYAKYMNLIYYDENGNVVNPYNGEKWAYKIFVDATGQRFLLKNESQPIPGWAEGKYDKVINVPLKNVVVMSSTHIALMEAINDDGSVINSVKGIMWGKSYKWYFEDINKSLAEGKIIDVGSDYNPDWDKIIVISPQVVFVYPEYSGDKVISKCKDLGITYVADAEYLENSHLARCEWVKMFAAFYNKEDVAKGYFDGIEGNVSKIKGKLSNVNEKPAVIWGYNSKWGCYVPREDSYVVKAIELCKGNYIFKELNGTENAKIDYETFAEKAKDADIWIIPSSTTWLSNFKENHPGYETFKAVKNGRVFCVSPDYWQVGLLKTDEVLLDLATILHPEIFKGRETHFFLKYNIEKNTAEPFRS
ncbi:ABC transporter substrate-binding protein [Methanocaldococcus fervens]|uniref:Periplasmic binding protein n=1 Tax=Methanocaldococcus fervens (strain DSM 4213 / JCM 15782 / AG86) TaxID=573064 RepID=C7P839_METFA|nr:ABC transporter substrate-binding protein [Methanocaldococcus fervens]ACV24721.1 periplasmic binding protein [Methanocaldococcus fervens AG86]